MSMYSLNALHAPFLAQKRCKITTIFPTTQIFNTLFSKNFSLNKKSATACVITPRCAKQCARPKSRRRRMAGRRPSQPSQPFVKTTNYTDFADLINYEWLPRCARTLRAMRRQIASTKSIVLQRRAVVDTTARPHSFAGDCDIAPGRAPRPRKKAEGDFCL